MGTAASTDLTFTSYALVFDFDKLVALLVLNDFKEFLQFSQ